MPSPVESFIYIKLASRVNVEPLLDYIPRTAMGVERDELPVILFGAVFGGLVMAISSMIMSLLLWVN